MRRTGITALLLAGFIAVACKSPEEKLIDRREQLRAKLDRLYETYAAQDRDGTAQDRAGTAQEAASSGGVLGRFLAQVDRAHFDEYCLAIGRGERPFSFSGKLETFMKVKKNARGCRKAAEIQLSIDALERDAAREAAQR